MSKKLCLALIISLCFSPLVTQAAKLLQSSPSLIQAAANQTVKPAEDMQRLRASLQAKLDELHRSAEFPGATVGFILADGRFASVSTGLADLENRIPLRPTDKMLAGSIGKTYFAAVVMQLVQEGKLRLDEKIEKWFGRDPWFARLPNAREITVKMLMNHTSGLAEYYGLKGFMDRLRTRPDLAFKPEMLVECVLDSKPLFVAGQGWSYADTNYILVGMIVERITGKSLYSEVEKRILKPLKLTRTIPSDRRVLPGVITGYSMPNSPFGFEGRVIQDGKFIINPQFEWAGGGYATTAEELARWAKALYEGRTFKPAMLELMLEAVPAKTGRGDKYGLGVQVRQSNWGASYGHGGWFPGYLSEMEYFPEHKVAIAIQVNTDASRKLKKGLRAYIADVARIVIGVAATKKAA
jgi:D-alanyl-D-alanine carboxypeptidase